jgi:hypothetical protein
MRHSTWIIPVALITPFAGAGAQADSTESPSAPLFSSHEPLRLVLRAPFHSLFGNRDEDAPALPATMIHVQDGDSVHMELDVELRGNNRRKSSVCNFPPLRIDFPRSEMSGTVFENQNRLKVVTQCQSGRDQYEQYVLLEYLIYRSLNVLTDLSFQVRLAHFIYEDTEGRRDTLEQTGFIIEDDDDMAERNGWEILEIPIVSPHAVDQQQVNLVEVFQFMIGHTDFSAFAVQEGEDQCCHNGRLVGSMAGPVYPVPYDFDFAGLINARYAEVAPGINARSVRQRVYRGVCHPDETLQETIRRFVEKKDEIYQLFQNQQGLEDRQKQQAIDYLDEFYEIITDPGQTRRRLSSQCRRLN